MSYRQIPVDISTIQRDGTKIHLLRDMPPMEMSSVPMETEPSNSVSGSLFRHPAHLILKSMIFLNSSLPV